MRFFRELRILFKDILIIFLPKEVKEAYGVVYEIDREVESDSNLSWGGTWSFVRQRIENYLIVDTNLFLNAVRIKRVTPREIVYNMTYKISSDQIQTTDLYTSKTKGFENLNKYITRKINKLNGHL